MTYAQFREIVISLDDYNDNADFDLFVAERGWQEWMDEYYDESGESNRIIPILSAVWGMHENPIKGIKKAANLTNAKLSELYSIPIRSIESWSSGERVCPTYTSTMLAYCVFGDKGII